MITKACTPTNHSSEGRTGATARFVVGGKPRRAAQYLGNAEPLLEDLLCDDVLMRLMARDGVGAEQVRQLAGHIPN